MICAKRLLQYLELSMAAISICSSSLKYHSTENNYESKGHCCTKRPTHRHAQHLLPHQTPVPGGCIYSLLVLRYCPPEETQLHARRIKRETCLLYFSYEKCQPYKKPCDGPTVGAVPKGYTDFRWLSGGIANAARENIMSKSQCYAKRLFRASFIHSFRSRLRLPPASDVISNPRWHSAPKQQQNAEWMSNRSCLFVLALVPAPASIRCAGDGWVGGKVDEWVLTPVPYQFLCK